MAGKRKRHDEALLARCVERVLGGERPAGVAEQAGIPYSTLMTRVTWKKRGQKPVTAATRKKKRPKKASASGEDAISAPESDEPPTELPRAAERDLLAWMARLQRAHISVRRRDVLDKANGILAALGGAPALGAVWFTHFRERHPEITGHGTNLVVADEAVAGIEAAKKKVADREAAAPWAAVLDPTPMNTLKQHDTTESSEDAVAASATSDASSGSAEAAPSQPSAAKEDDAMGMTPSERAVALLQDCYCEKLAPEDLAEAFDVALDPRKAKLLLVLRPGELRDLWVARQIEKRRRSVAATAPVAPSAAAASQENAATTVV